MASAPTAETGTHTVNRAASSRSGHGLRRTPSIIAPPRLLSRALSPQGTVRVCHYGGGRLHWPANKRAAA
jgi:hypothetical protein